MTLIKKIILIGGFFSVIAHMSFAQSIQLNEDFLKLSLKENPPTIDQIETALLGAQTNVQRIDDQFNTNIKGSAYYTESNEKEFSMYIPVTSPYSNYQVEVQRQFSSGVQVGVKGYMEKFTNNFAQDATTTGLTLSLGVSLWKDLIGKRTSSQLEKAKMGTEQAKLQSEIGRKSFYNGLRKIYWSLVANEEAIRISQGLIKSSLKQVAEAKKRLSNNTADKGEVARYQSQVSARKAMIVNLKYNREMMIQQLKTLLPSTAERTFTISSNNMNQTVKKVMACTSEFASAGSPPLENTFYDEIIDILDKQSHLEQKVNDSYDDVDVKLQTEYGIRGKDFSRSDSVNDFTSNGKNHYAVGLMLDIPLEGKKKSTADIMKKVTKLKYRAKKQQELGRVRTFHTQTVRQISLLQEVMSNQRNNTQFLQESLKSSEKKYRQARLSVQQLVQEQDMYLQSNLDEVMTKLKIITTVLDYLSVYTETPCPLN